MSGINLQARKDLKLAAAVSTGVTLSAGQVFPTLTKGHELDPMRKQRISCNFILNPTAGAGGAAGGMGQKIIAVPKGFAEIKAVIANLHLNSVGSGASVVWSLGSVQAAQDATLTSTEADLIASTSVGTVTAATDKQILSVTAVPVANQAIDASAGDKDFYLNIAGTWTHASLNPLPVVVTGYVDIVWQYLGQHA